MTTNKPLIRAMNRSAFRSGEWARITGVTILDPPDEIPRICYIVEFIDGEGDLWPIEDLDARYEFLPSIHTPTASWPFNVRHVKGDSDAQG